MLAHEAGLAICKVHRGVVAGGQGQGAATCIRSFLLYPFAAINLDGKKRTGPLENLVSNSRVLPGSDCTTTALERHST